jgi:hypothetical protein
MQSEDLFAVKSNYRISPSVLVKICTVDLLVTHFWLPLLFQDGRSIFSTLRGGTHGISMDSAHQCRRTSFSAFAKSP